VILHPFWDEMKSNSRMRTILASKVQGKGIVSILRLDILWRDFGFVVGVSDLALGARALPLGIVHFGHIASSEAIVSRKADTAFTALS